MELIVMVGLMIGTLLIGYVIGVKKKSETQAADKWMLLNYLSYTDTSYGNRLLSSRFTVTNLTTQKVYNRISYGKCYSQGEVMEAIKHGVAHKLGSEELV